MKRRALGKGLGSLLPERLPDSSEKKFLHLELDRISPNPNQPRASLDEEDLEDLAASIREAGVLQPVLVREAGSGFELIAGERRWRAARLAGLQKVPALLQRVEPERSLELALIENIQRQQLNPIDEAKAFATLVKDYGLTQEQVALKVGRKRPSIANSLRLLKLPERVQTLIRSKALSSGHAKALLALADEEEILKAAEAMLQGYVTVRGAEEMARERKPPANTDSRTHGDPNVKNAEERLQRALGTKVRIRSFGDGKGRIEIDFHSEEELERLFETLEMGEA